MVPSKNVPVSTTYKEVLRRLNWESKCRFMNNFLTLSLSTFRTPAEIQTYWSRECQPVLSLRSWINTKVSPYSQGQSQSTAPHYQGCSTWEPELAVALLGLHEGGWGLWLSAPDSGAVPLMHVRSVFAHCLPHQELHCAVKLTINKRWEKWITHILKIALSSETMREQRETKTIICLNDAYLLVYLCKGYH